MERRHAVITEEGLARLRSWIGEESPVRNPYVRYATIDAIKHWCYGIGDANPLYTDEGYGKNTRWGTAIAPPTLLLATLGQRPRQGLPGIHSFWSGAEIEYYLPIRAGDIIDNTVCISAVDEKPISKFAGRSVRQEWTYAARNQSGKIVGKTREWSIRTERDASRETGKYKRLTPRKWTAEEIEKIDAEYEKEEIRGSVPRDWDDVQIGEELPPRVKGPLTITDLIAFKMGWGYWFVRAHRIGADYRRRHPKAYIADALGIPDIVERVHFDIDFANEAGVPFPFDYGPQRFSWLCHTVTDWMGDDGFVTRIKSEMRRFNLLGDCTWCRGKVVKKYISQNQPLVEVELTAVDQRDEPTAWGSATVMLPMKSKGIWPPDILGAKAKESTPKQR